MKIKNPISMFFEKAATGEPSDWSMTRVTVSAFTIAYVFRVFRFSLLGLAFGWPDVFAIFSILFALPFSYLFGGAKGAELFGKLLDKFGVGTAAVNATSDVIKATVEKKTNYEPEPDAAATGEAATTTTVEIRDQGEK